MTLESLVLLSGGVDSAACLHMAAVRGRGPVRALFVDYGQRCAVSELVAAKSLAQHYAVRLDEVRIGVALPAGDEVPGRNAGLVFAALMQWSGSATAITLGIHRDARYYDCSERFATDLDNMIAAYTEGLVRLVAPLLAMHKPAIVAYCRANGVPLGLTYSCLRGNKPCGGCASCLDRTRLNL